MPALQLLDITHFLKHVFILLRVLLELSPLRPDDLSAARTTRNPKKAVRRRVNAEVILQKVVDILADSEATVDRHPSDYLTALECHRPLFCFHLFDVKRYLDTDRT